MGLEAGIKMITSHKKDKAIDNNATYREILTVAHKKWPQRSLPQLPAFCKQCDREIAPQRMLLIPESQYCIDCAKKLSRKRMPAYLFKKAFFDIETTIDTTDW